MDPMAALIIKKFIQRRDVKAIQMASGAYVPVCAYNPQTNKYDGARKPFMVKDVEDHLAGNATYGHYLIDHEDHCKLFAFDIDLEKNRPASHAEPYGFTGSWPEFPDLTEYQSDINNDTWRSMVKVHQIDPRETWKSRIPSPRPWLKFQLRTIAQKLARIIYEEFEIPVGVAYSGSKGLHVYGFTETIAAKEAREAAETVIALSDEFELFRGKNFYRHKNQDAIDGFPNLSIEIFPKQDSLNGKDLGNLMRLPLGRNVKSTDPTFFLDLNTPMNVIAPHKDQIKLLETGNPWL